MPVPNYVEIVQSDPSFRRLEIGDLLFAEYSCPTTERFFRAWSHIDYVIHALSGKKILHTSGDSVPVRGGETVLVRKGCTLLEQFFDEDFCMIVSFLPDRFVSSVAREMAAELGGPPPPVDRQQTVMPVQDDPGITGYFHSLRSYFASGEQPSEALLRLKLRELVVGLLFSRTNAAISGYLRSIAPDEGPSIADVMERNFTSNLSLEDFAKICHRSLSSFKRDFAREFDETPGRWLLRRRLEFAAGLLRGGRATVTQAAFDSGFEDLSHFSRAFKRHFGESPSRFGTSGASAG